MITNNQLALKSVEYRKKVLHYIRLANAGHTGGSLSCLDILNVLYNRILNVSPSHFDDADRDRFIQSKGHSVEALYVILADKGFFPETDLQTLGQYQSHYVGHPTRRVHGVEQNTGGLGHGLSISSGMALAGKIDDKSYRVFTLLGDGELAEGSNWEAAMFAAHNKLDNLTAIIDCNGLQITGPTQEVCSIDPITEKFKAFGWSCIAVDGHDFAALSHAFSQPCERGKPTAVVAYTTKGKGVSYMENNFIWHHKVPTDDEYKTALLGLDEQVAALSGI